MLKRKILAVIATVYVLILSSRKWSIFICKIKKITWVLNMYLCPSKRFSITLVQWGKSPCQFQSWRSKSFGKTESFWVIQFFFKDIFSKQQLSSKIIYYVLLEIRSTLLMIMPLTVKNRIAYTFYLSCPVIKITLFKQWAMQWNSIFNSISDKLSRIEFSESHSKYI